MKRRKSIIVILAAIISITFAACGGDEPDEATAVAAPDQPVSSEDTPVPTATPEPTPLEPVFGEANVDSVQVVILESFPVQVNVIARGQHSDGCTEMDDIITERSGNSYSVTITTVRPGDLACTEALVPFEETIPLDVLNLEAGSYTVDVNGITGSFTLDVDNRIPTEETPEPTATPEPEASSAAITGRVWHDLCAVISSTGEEAAEPSEGCIATADGDGFQANGLLEDDEPGIEGVLVTVGEGECPGEELSTATTDETGEYSFDELAAGTYCVAVDALIEQNNAVLLPGSWTFPGNDENSTTVELGAEENLTSVNFGWDYQFLPLPEVDPTTCTRSIEFIEDLSVPDDTLFGPGEEFVKSWRLRNSGTCPWTTEYSLTSVGGDDIPSPDSLPLPSSVAPGQTIDLSVAMTAPEEFGTYRENWQLSDANGQPFGVGGLIEEAFWVQIIVAEPEATPVPGSAVIGGVVWADSCRLLQDGTPSAGCVETAEDSGLFIADGTLNLGETGIPDLVVTLGQEACPDDGTVPPADVVATATTDQGGLYRFPGLDEGTYCVAIDAFSDENVDILIPGDWTWPAPGVGRATVFLDAGEELLEIDFGWDHGDD